MGKNLKNKEEEKLGASHISSASTNKSTHSNNSGVLVNPFKIPSQSSPHKFSSPSQGVKSITV